MNILHFAYSKDKQEPSTMTLDHGQWMLTIRQTDGSLMLVFDTLADFQAFFWEIYDVLCNNVWTESDRQIKLHLSSLME